MKVLFNSLVITFILSILLGLLFFNFYFQSLMYLFDSLEPMQTMESHTPPDPKIIFEYIFNPKVIFTGIGLLGASLANTIIGIVIISKNKIMKSEPKVLWILGFVFLSFVTNIIFFALKKDRNLLGETSKDPLGY